MTTSATNKSWRAKRFAESRVLPSKPSSPELYFMDRLVLSILSKQCHVGHSSQTRIMIAEQIVVIYDPGAAANRHASLVLAAQRIAGFSWLIGVLILQTNILTQCSQEMLIIEHQ